jgi:hypothetical protein
MTENWIIAARFLNLGEAQAALSALRAAGLACHLADENLIGIDWGVSLAVGGVKVLVRPEDLLDARAIIGGVTGETTIEPARELPRTPIVCPDCGSPDLQPIPRLRILVFAVLVFVGIGAAIGEMLLALTALLAVVAAVLLMPSTRCKSCRHRWSPPPPEHELAPPPDATDTVEQACPRCGSFDVYRIDYRRLKAIPLLFNPAIFIAAPIWLLKPKLRCDACGLEMR